MMLAQFQALKSEARANDPSSKLASASMDDLKAAVADYVLKESTMRADITGIDIQQAEAIGLKATLNAREEPSKLFSSSAESAKHRVTKFESFVTKAIDEMHTDLTVAEKKGRLALYMDAYEQDHGKPFFSREGMRDITASEGRKNVAKRGLEGEYSNIVRVFTFGNESEFKASLRLERHLKHELGNQYPSLNDEQIAAKISGKEYGESLISSFNAKEIERAKFLEFAKANPDPLSREIGSSLSERENIMSAYDNEHYPRKETLVPIDEYTQREYNKLKTQWGCTR